MSTVPVLYIFNTTICTTPGLSYHTRLVSEGEARSIMQRFAPDEVWENGPTPVTSAIGHEATAQVASAVLGRPIPVNRVPAAMVTNDEALCIKLRGRAPEGVILSRSEMEAIGYDIVHMLARGTSSPAAEIAGRWLDPYGWEQGAPPADIEFSVPHMERRLQEEIDAKVKAQIEAGIAYQGSDPAGMLRVSMLTMLRRIVHEHLDASVADARRGGKVTDDDLRRMRSSLIDRLVDQINERGEEVDCGRGEQDET